MRLSVCVMAAVLAGFVVGCTPAPAPKEEAAPAPVGAPVVPAANMAPLAYELSQHSPALDAAARTAVSQAFNGAPLSGAAQVYQIAADQVRCRAKNDPTPTGAEGTVTYTAGKDVPLTGEEATALFEALKSAGIEGDAGMGHIERIATAVACTADIATALATPATGNQIAGFTCTFTTP